jgi:predicted amidophosphoribosyltransferase
MRCRICQAYIPEGATYCLECGADIDSMPEVVCQRCGSAVSRQASYCRKCGAPIEPEGNPRAENQDKISATATSCPRCGAEVPAGIRYCPNCGTNQEHRNEEKPATVETAPPEKPIENLHQAVEVLPDAYECPRCGAPARGLGRFCYNCGRFLRSDVEDVICPECGSTNPLRYIRCQYCGAGLPSSPESDT